MGTGKVRRPLPRALKRISRNKSFVVNCRKPCCGLLKQRYGDQVEVVTNDPDQTDELRLLDSDGERVLNNIHFRELGQPIYYEPEMGDSQKIN